MNTSLSAACLLGLASILNMGTAAAAPNNSSSTSALIDACHPGRLNDNAPTPGSTPIELKGAQIVSSNEASCLMSKLGKNLTVIAVLDEERKLPGAVSMPWAAGRDRAVGTRLKETLALMGKGKPEDPLLFYCHNTSCSNSYQAARHAVDAGYRNVFWFRDGMRGWENDGFAFEGEENRNIAGRFMRRLSACTRTLQGKREVIEIMASYKPLEFEAREVGSTMFHRELVGSCLRAVEADYSADKERKEQVVREIARNDDFIVKSASNARAALASDARLYLVPLLDKVQVDKIDAYVSGAHSLQSVDASCPAPAFQLPRTSAQAGKIRTELRSYTACLDKLRSGSFATFQAVDSLDSVSNLVVFAEPYVCGKNASPNCVPVEAWRRVAAAVSADKLRVVAQGEAKREALLKQMIAAQTRLNAFMPVYIQAENAVEEQEEKARGGKKRADDDDDL